MHQKHLRILFKKMPPLSLTKAMPRSWHSLAWNGMEIYLNAIRTLEIYLEGSLVFWSDSRVMALPGMKWNGMLGLKRPLYLNAIKTDELFLEGSLVFWSVSRVMALPGMEWNGMLALKQPLVGEKGRHRVLSRGEGQTNANWKFVLILDQQLYSQHYSGELQRARKFH